ncbi:MAG: SDR family oxidoreductase [Pseudomonadota bacterium]
MTIRLDGLRALITQADDFMGPAAAEGFRRAGADVVADARDLTEPGSCKALVAEAVRLDILVANLAGPNFSGTPATDLTDDQWATCFETMVHPLHRLCRAVLPQMLERGRGKIIVFGSATALKGVRNVSAYSAARSAQAGYVRALGVEVARSGVNVNLIAQNWVENPAYYPRELQETEKFQKALRAQVPIGRLAKPEEDVALALFLASDQSDFLVGQILPFDGGWTA